MRADYNMTGAERRELVHAIEEITGEHAVYKFVPTCAYEIGDITVGKEGGVNCEDEVRLRQMMAALEEKGFHSDAEPEAGQEEDPEEPVAEQEETPETDSNPEDVETEEAAEGDTETGATEAEEQPETEPDAELEAGQAAAEEPEAEAAGETVLVENTKAPALTISMPLASANVGTLTNILSAKGDLIRHALGVTDIRINVTEDKIEFPWFDRELTPEETNACMLLITKLCELSKELKHASAKPVETDNEKYAFRCFLLRLGFIGPDYKPARKILLKNLTGSSAFRSGAPKKEAEEQE